MNKAVMISIRPEWVEKICRGEKVVEVRKNRPKLQTPFKCYIYETQGRTDTPWVDEDGHVIFAGRGEVIGEFICDTYVIDNTFGHDPLFNAAACMSEDDTVDYANGSPLYGWHISDLVVYDKPKELGEFSPVCKYKNDDGSCPSRKVACPYQRYDYNSDGTINIVECGKIIERPPQSWFHVDEM